MFLQINGQLLNVVSFGHGARTIVTHGGWVGNWELWQQPFELLSQSWRCIGYDHRGSGESVVPLDQITPEALVDDVFGVLDAMNVDRCILAAESLGTVVAMAAALADPERFEGLVLVDGGSSVGDQARHLVAGALSDYPATVEAFVDDCVPEPDGEHFKRWGRHMLMRSDGPTAARILQCYLDSDQPPTPLHEITVPTLVIHGTADRIRPPELGIAMAAGIPGATLVMIEGAGHVPTVTHPNEVVKAILERFDG